MTSQAMVKLADNERYLFEAADIAYFKAGRTSDPQDWLEAGLLARQHRNALTELRLAAAPAASQGQCDVTLTERFENPACRCDTYAGNLGPCRRFETGENGRCVYCDHDPVCHDAVAQPAASRGVRDFQPRVLPWLLECFGPVIPFDKQERNHRFLEEALELVQACGCTQSEAHQLVDYVYGRDQGDRYQEAGGVMVTLAALCIANGFDMHAAGETELARIWTKVETIRAKQAAKPKHSPLPAAVTAPPLPADGVRERLAEMLANHDGNTLEVEGRGIGIADHDKEKYRQYADRILKLLASPHEQGEG